MCWMPRPWPVMPVRVVLITGVLAAGLVMVFVYPADGASALFPAVGVNLLIFGSMILAWYAAIAIYKLVREPAEPLDQIFA